MVEAGKAKSITEEVSISSTLVFFLVISGSEQIQIGFIFSKDCALHSFKVCPRSAIEGTKKRTNPFPLVSFSAIRSEVNVLPVPQAIISFPLSFS